AAARVRAGAWRIRPPLWRAPLSTRSAKLCARSAIRRGVRAWPRGPRRPGARRRVRKPRRGLPRASEDDRDRTGAPSGAATRPDTAQARARRALRTLAGAPALRRGGSRETQRTAGRAGEL